MSGVDLLELLLAWLPSHAPLLLSLAAFGGALGLPLPTPLLVAAAGALARQGVVDPGWAVLGCIAGSLTGETLYYAVGRYGGGWAGPRAVWFLAGTWQSAQARFRERPALTIYLTRFLLTPLGIPVSVIAGSSSYPYGLFTACAVAGDLVWIALYGLSGFLLGSEWQAFGQELTRYGGWIAAFTAGGCALYVVWRHVQRSDTAATSDRSTFSSPGMRSSSRAAANTGIHSSI